MFHSGFKTETFEINKNIIVREQKESKNYFHFLLSFCCIYQNKIKNAWINLRKNKIK